MLIPQGVVLGIPRKQYMHRLINKQDQGLCDPLIYITTRLDQRTQLDA